MAIQLCPVGHIYDDKKYAFCPCCKVENINTGVYSDSEVFSQEYVAPSPHVALSDNQSSEAQSVQDTQDMQTVYIDQAINDKGIADVRGWLVCLEGTMRGMDFRLYGGNNTIGRGDENNIKLEFDNTVSKGVNAIIAYDAKNNKFFITLSGAKNSIYVNNQLLLTPTELCDYDVIEIGMTKLVFRSLCNEKFNWE